MQPRAEEFLQLLNQIDEHLKQRVKRHEGRGFMMRLDIAARQDPALARFKEELREFSELRNAIVHYREFPARVIAEPTEDALGRLRTIADQILNPPRLLPTFASKVRCFSADDPLREAVQFMSDTEHSQVPVVKDGALLLLSTEGVGRWVMQNPGCNLAASSVGDVLQYERPGNFLVLSGDELVVSARTTFRRELGKGRRLQAILITRQGEPKPPLLGIATASDLLRQQVESA